MTTADDTRRLIRSLASDARRGAPRPSVRSMLGVSAAAGFGCALLASSIFLVDKTRLADAVHHRWLYQKLVCMVALAAAAWPILEDLARPERLPPRYGCLLPAVSLMLAGAAFDDPGVGFAGRAPYSAPACVAAIILLSLPGLGLILAGLRQAAASTRPATAGLAAGLLAGSLAAVAYAFACRNDGGVFILVWYGVALAIVGALGAAAGRIALAW